MKQTLMIALIAFVSEALTITWRWGHSPTHGVRDWYEGSFKTYFAESITEWLIIFAVLSGLWLVITKIVTRKKQNRI